MISDVSFSDPGHEDAERTFAFTYGEDKRVGSLRSCK